MDDRKRRNPLGSSRSLMVQHRIPFLFAALLTLIVGLASRKFSEQLPVILAIYSGDTLWAMMLFLVVSTILVDRSIYHRMLIAVVIATLVEISQLYQASWINSIRQTTLGGLVLGHGFLWTDLICYASGIALAAAGEYGLRRVWQYSKWITKEP